MRSSSSRRRSPPPHARYQEHADATIVALAEIVVEPTVTLDSDAVERCENAEAAALDLLDHWIRGRAASTQTAYRTALGDFAERCDFCSVGEAVAALLVDRGRAYKLAVDFRAALVEDEVAPSSINVKLSALRSLVDHTRKLGLLSWELEVENVRSEKYRDTAGPGIAAARKMFDAIRGTTCEVRDRALLWLIIGHALRRNEVVSLDLVHVDLKRSVIMILGKGKREREPVTLSQQAHRALAAWLEVRGRKPGPLFVSMPRDRRRGGRRVTGRDVHRLFRRVARRAGVDRAHPHLWRHSAITAALDMGVDVRDVARFSRHADVRTVLRYDDNRRDLGGEVARLIGEAVEPSEIQDKKDNSNSEQANRGSARHPKEKRGRNARARDRG